MASNGCTSCGLPAVVALWILCLQVVCTEHGCFVVTIYKLKTADCDHKNLKTVPEGLSSDINVLKFNDNQLTYLGIDQFKDYKLLQEIYLVRNRIEIIAPDAFRHLYNLQILNLEGNLLSEVPSDVFQHLRSVRILSLKSNQIKYITNTALRYLEKIEELNFENCWLMRIEPLAFKGLNDLNEINLVNNELRSLSAEMRSALPPSLKIMRLHRNPWMCDCKIRWLREWLTTNKINWQFTTHNSPACDGPALISKIHWTELSPDQFACASRIVANSSTSIELQMGGNVTIECVVFGDPEPTISWKKDDKYLSKDNVKERHLIPKDGEKHIRSSLSLNDVTEKNAGDYKCIAKNSAGRSEVTYKVWVEGEDEPATVINVFNLSREALMGIVVSVCAFLVLCTILVVYFIRRRDRKNRAYRVKQYKRAANKGPAVKADKDHYDADTNAEENSNAKEKEQSSVAVAHTELLLAKEAANKEPDSITADLKVEVKPQNNIHHNKPEGPTEFKMKIFTSFGDNDKDTRTHLDHGGATSPDAEDAANKAEIPECNHIREATPDLLCDDKHTRSNHKTPTPPPPPAAYFANHIVATQKRAEENPYAKPSELKSGGQKTPDSEKTLLDYSTKGLDKNNKACDTEPEPVKITVLSPKLTKEGQSAKGRHKSDTSKDSPCSNVSSTSSKDVGTPCMNPVCLKTHSRSRSQADPSAPRSQSGKSTNMSSSQSLGSMNDLDSPGTLDRRSSAKGRSAGDQRHDDRYKTLPCRGQANKGSPSRKLPLTPGQSCASPPGGALHTEKSATVSRPRVQFASPVRESPSSSVSSTPTSPRPHKPQSPGTWGAPTRTTNPLHPKGLKVMSPEGPRTLTFPGAIETLTAPVASAPALTKPSRTYGCSTSIDDLLSPPFGGGDNTQSQKAAKHQRPRPGHKDEYGTAV